MQIIPLHKPSGSFTIVDDDDAWAADLRLRLHQDTRRYRPKMGRWTRRIPLYHVCHGRQKLHRTIHERAYGPLGSLIVDHRNGVGFDNRRTNLRAMPLTQVSRLCRDTTRGIFEGRDRNEKGFLLSTTHYSVVHGHKRLGTYPTYEEALAVKRAAEERDGYPPPEDRDALLGELIELLERFVTEGRLARLNVPHIESRYRLAA